MPPANVRFSAMRKQGRLGQEALPEVHADPGDTDVHDADTGGHAHRVLVEAGPISLRRFAWSGLSGRSHEARANSLNADSAPLAKGQEIVFHAQERYAGRVFT